MLNNGEKTEKNKGTPSPLAENHNKGNSEKGNSTGLIVAGLVTIVGSWVGMAAYLDYRLESVEQKISTESRQVVSAYDAGKNAITQEVNSLGTSVTNNVKETSSVLAKGILDINQKGDERYNTLISAVNNNNTLIEKNQSEITLSISKALKESEKQNSNLISSIQQIGNELGTGQSKMLSQLDSSSKTLADLIKLSSDSRGEQLNQLASAVGSISEGLKDGNQKFSTEMNALAERVSSIQQAVADSKSAIQDIKKLVPEWKDSSDKQLAALNESAKGLDEHIQSNLTLLEKRVVELGTSLESTSGTLMKTLYAANEGLEGTKVEIKSELTTRNQQTQDEIKSLAQSVLQVNSALENLKVDLQKNTTVTKTGETAKDRSKELADLTTSIQSLTEKMSTLKTHVSSQVTEAQARAKILMESENTAGQNQNVKEILNQFGGIADEATGQLDVLLKGLQSLSETISALSKSPSGDKGISVITETSSAPDPICNEAKPTETGMNPEERPQTETKVPGR